MTDQKQDRIPRTLVAALITQFLIALVVVGCITVNPPPAPVPAPGPVPVPSPVEPGAATGTEAKVRASIVRWENAVSKDYQAVADNPDLKSVQQIDDFLKPRMQRNREELYAGIGEAFSAAVGVGEVSPEKRKAEYGAAARGAKR